MWNFDGVACAAAIEIGNPVYLFHSQHLLYGFLGFCFWKLLHFPFGMLRALPALQIFTSLLSATGLSGLYFLLENQCRRPLLALIVTSSMAVGAVFWVWSIEPQVYALGFLGLAWATYFLFRSESRWKWESVGAWHALGVLGHAANILWILPALYWIWREPSAGLSSQDRMKRTWRYTSILLSLVGIPYLLVLGLFIIPTHGPTFVFNWLKGSASLTLDRHWQWHGGGWHAPLSWAHTTLSFFWGTFWPYRLYSGSGVVYAITAVSAMLLGLVLFFAWKATDPWRRNFALLWIGVFALFWWSWEPSTECYRMAEAVPFGILLTLGLQQWKQEKRALGVGLILAMTFLGINWQTRVYLMNQTENNTLYMQTLAVAKLTPSNSLYLTEGGLPWIYLLYFTGRSGWNIHLLRTDRLAQHLKKNKSIQSIFVYSSALRDASAQAWLTDYKLVPVAPGLPWLQLQ
jgi:hypothetical protein